jgi:hypothetical protein
MRKFSFAVTTALASVTLVAATVPERALPDTNYCRTATDTAATLAPILTALLTGVPPGDLDDYGFISAPESVSVVANESTCQSVVNAYNGFIATVDSTRQVSSAYIFTDGVGYIFPIFQHGGSTFNEVLTADSTFVIRLGFEVLH